MAPMAASCRQVPRRASITAGPPLATHNCCSTVSVTIAPRPPACVGSSDGSSPGKVGLLGLSVVVTGIGRCQTATEVAVGVFAW